MDTFYILPRTTGKKVHEALLWAKERAIQIDVDMLDGTSVARKRANKSFEEVLPLLGNGSTKFFRVVHRESFNTFLVLPGKTGRRDLVEVFVRGIDVGPTEYFVFMYLDDKVLPGMIKKFNLHAIN